MSKRRATEVVEARGRLKGALHNITHVSDVDQEEDVDATKPGRGRPPKRIKRESSPTNHPQATVQHSFFMKLFDRCVDLAKYNENTALYPICRAWMVNQPRSSSIINYKTRKEAISVKREPNDDLLDDLVSGKVSEVTDLPPCNNVQFPRIPSPLPAQLNGDNAELDKAVEAQEINHDELMNGWKQRWGQVRKKWADHTKVYDETVHGNNIAIIEALYKK